MCKTWSIKYGCGHICNFRLSVCRGTHTVLTKHNTPRVSCSGDPCFVLQETQFCGDCGRADAEEDLRAAHEHLRLRLAMRARRASHDLSAGPSDDMRRADEDFGTDLWRLTRRFPNPRIKRLRSPTPARATAAAKSTRGSLLRREVLADELAGTAVGKGDAAAGWADGSETALLADEVSERASAGDVVDETGGSIEDWLAAADVNDDEKPRETGDDEAPPRTEDSQPAPRAAPPSFESKSGVSLVAPHRKVRLTARLSAPKGRGPQGGALSPLMELVVR